MATISGGPGVTYDLPTASSIGAIPETEKGAPNGVATLGPDGKVLPSELPPLDREVGEAADEAAMLALPVSAPAECVRTDFTPPHIFYLSADPATQLSNWHDLGSLSAGDANPTGLVGTTAVNGVAATYMRSDAAPAINQAIVPTWTGAHTFTQTMTTAAITASGTISSSAGVAGNTTVTAGIGSNSAQMAGAPNGSDPVIRALGATDANVSLQFEAKGSGQLKFASPSTFSGNVAVAGQLGSAANTSLPSPTNSGITIGGAPTWAMQSFYDQSVTANNRTADLLFITNSIKFRFANDARDAFLDVFSINGGQALGVTGITSTSGSGAWAHTGAFSTTGTATVLPAGGNGVITTGTNAAGAPSIEATGAANDISLEIKAKAGGSIGFAGAAYLWAANAPWTVSGSTGVPGQALMSNGNAAAPTWSTPLPAAVASTALIDQSADASVGALYAVTADGTYRASCYVVLTRAATTSATLPGCNVNYTDLITNVAMTSQAAQSATGNVVGTHIGGVVVFEAKSGTNVGFATTGYASSGATTMQYRVRVVIERIQ